VIKAGHFNKKREVNAFECYTEELVSLFGILLCKQSHRCSLRMRLHSFLTYLSLSMDVYKEVRCVS